MTDQELLARAIEFDAGPPPILNGRLWNPEWADSHLHNVRIVMRLNAVTGQKKWAINDGFHDLTKSGHWESARSGSRTNDAYLKRCRYDSAQEAFDVWERYRSAVLAWAYRKLKKEGPDVILNVPERIDF